MCLYAYGARVSCVGQPGLANVFSPARRLASKTPIASPAIFTSTHLAQPRTNNFGEIDSSPRNKKSFRAFPAFPGEVGSQIKQTRALFPSDGSLHIGPSNLGMDGNRCPPQTDHGVSFLHPAFQQEEREGRSSGIFVTLSPPDGFRVEGLLHLAPRRVEAGPGAHPGFEDAPRVRAAVHLPNQRTRYSYVAPNLPP